MSLSNKELSLIKDTDFLLSKVKIIEQIESLLSETKNRLIEVIENGNLRLFSKFELKKGRVFKGEYYRGLPFVTLDFPNTFEKKNVFFI